MLIEKTADLRYYGQVREQTAAVPDGPVIQAPLAITSQRFHDKHRTVIGYADEGYPTEIARLHLTGTAKVEPPSPRRIEAGGESAAAAVKSRRPAFFGDAGGFVEVPIYDGDRVVAGNRLEGPCVVEETMTTLVIPPGPTVPVDAHGNSAPPA